MVCQSKLQNCVALSINEIEFIVATEKLVKSGFG